MHLNTRNFLAKVALAKVHWRQGLLDKAEVELGDVIRTHSGFGVAHADRGIVLAQLRRYAEALPELKRGIELGSREAITYNYLGVSEAEAGHFPQALAAFEKALEVDPRYATAALNLALQYRSQGDPAQARVYFQKVCKHSEELCKQLASHFPTSSK